MNAFPENPNPPIPPERSGAAAEHLGAQLDSQASGPTEIPLSELSVSLAPPPANQQPQDPAWNALDLIRLAVLAVIALIASMFAALFVARWWLYPHWSLQEVARVPLVVIAGQILAYLFIFAYMYILVTRERGRPNFLAAIHWNWPSSFAVYIAGGVVLSIALQFLASRLPMPKNLPIDALFRTPSEAWVLSIFSVTLAPLMEELLFRGFLYPVLARGMSKGAAIFIEDPGRARGVGLTAAIFVTAFAFALMHGQQLTYSWGPVLVIFLVGVVLTMIRAYKNSVAAGLVVHIAYNGTISTLMFIGTDGFRHLEKLGQ